MLTNDLRPDFWIGSEIQFVSAAETWWFVNLGASGYWNIGRAPFGTFPDRNDPGVVDEVTADRNARIDLLPLGFRAALEEEGPDLPGQPISSDKAPGIRTPSWRAAPTGVPCLGTGVLDGLL